MKVFRLKCLVLGGVGLAVLSTGSRIGSHTRSDGNRESSNYHTVGAGQQRKLAEPRASGAADPELSVMGEHRDADMASKFAYVTVLTREMDVGVRTLGQSIIDSGSKADRVVLVAPSVSSATEERLIKQGWIVRPLPSFEDTPALSPNSERIDGVSFQVLARVAVWSLTDYERVVFLEDSILVVENVDELFQCTGICAVLQQAELIRSSLIVLEPSVTIYEGMVAAAAETYSYSGDFGGFLSSYLSGFESCSIFDLENPFLQDPATDPRRGPDADLLYHTCHRLPTRYNGDLLLMMLNGGLGMVRAENRMPDDWWDQRRARVVDFKVAGLRPWDWFAAPFLPYASMWEAVRVRTEAGDPAPNLITPVMLWIVCLLLGTRILQCLAPSSGGGPVPFSRDGSTGSAAGERIRSRQRSRILKPNRRLRGVPGGSYTPRSLVWSLVHLAFGFSALLVAVLAAFAIVPVAADTGLSWAIFIVLACTIYGFLCSFYISVVSRQAQRSHRPLSGLAGGSALDLTYVAAQQAESGVDEGVASGEGMQTSRGPGEGVIGAGISTTPSPMGESVRCLACLGAFMGLMPRVGMMSRATGLAQLVIPPYVGLLIVMSWLTIEMIRLPVLWFDWYRARAGRTRIGRYG